MKKIIDLLGIVLPALIILLGILRVFLKKTKGVNGFTMLFAILLLLVGLAQWFVFGNARTRCDCDTKAQAEKVSKHSAAFNQSIEKVMTDYYALTSSFVKNDTGEIGQSGRQLAVSLDSLKIDDLKKDTAIFETILQFYDNSKTELASIIADPSLEEKRGSFNILSDNMRSLLLTAKYDLAKLYWLECDHAFGEDRPGNWLSKDEQAANPYGQADCRETRATVNFVAADTTKKAPGL